MLEHTKISRMSLICWQLQIRVYWSVEYLDALRRWSVPSAMDRCSVDVWHKSIIKLNWNTFLSLCNFQISWTYCSEKWITKRVLLWQREGLLKRSAIHKPDRDKKKVQRGLWTNIHFWFHKILHCHWKVCSQRILTFSPPCFLFSSWHLWPSCPVRGARRPSGNKPLNQPRLPPATFFDATKTSWMSIPHKIDRIVHIFFKPPDSKFPVTPESWRLSECTIGVGAAKRNT